MDSLTGFRGIFSDVHSLDLLSELHATATPAGLGKPSGAAGSIRP